MRLAVVFRHCLLPVPNSPAAAKGRQEATPLHNWVLAKEAYAQRILRTPYRRLAINIRSPAKAWWLIQPARPTSLAVGCGGQR